MGQVIQVNGDYNIKTIEGGTVTFDTGPGVGNVRVTGNLVVEGDTLTVSAEQLNVADNIITLNVGETGAGVTLRYSGIEVDRGSSIRSALVYDETIDSWIIGFGQATTGAFNYNLVGSRLRVRNIDTGDTGQDTGDLNLIGAGLGVINVSGTLNYEAQVTDADDIPNKKYVDDAIQLNPTFQAKRGNTRVAAFDIDDPLDPIDFLGNAIEPYISQPSESVIGVVIDGILNTEFYVDRVEIQRLTLIDNRIVNYDTSENIIIETNGTGKLETPYAIQMDQHVIAANEGTYPSPVSGSTVIAAGAPEVGTTGIYFVNNTKEGELISKNKALVLSMIF